MKDGLDVTALREVKFLQELHHPNIISVSGPRCLRFTEISSSDWQLLDVFSVKQNIHLVLEFLDTDLEAVIKDKALIFQQGDIKSWTLMTLRGLEYIHRYGVLHRVRRATDDIWPSLFPGALPRRHPWCWPRSMLYSPPPQACNHDASLDQVYRCENVEHLQLC